MKPDQAFSLTPGKLLCLHVPAWQDSSEDRLLVDALTGKCQVPGLRLIGRVEFARLPVGGKRLLGLFGRQSVVNWFCQTTGGSRAQALAVLERLGLPAKTRVDELPMTPRILLALEAAWARGADVIVFRTAGTDPAGRNAIFQAVTARLSQAAAIHLSYALTDGRRICPPQATCINLVQEALTGAS
jgi:hypothetical protein